MDAFKGMVIVLVTAALFWSMFVWGPVKMFG